MSLTSYEWLFLANGVWFAFIGAFGLFRPYRRNPSAASSVAIAMIANGGVVMMTRPILVLTGVLLPQNSAAWHPLLWGSVLTGAPLTAAGSSSRLEAVMRSHQRAGIAVPPTRMAPGPGDNPGASPGTGSNPGFPSPAPSVIGA